MLKLNLQHFGHLMQAADSLGKNPRCWKKLRAEREEGIRGWDGWMASLMQWTWTWARKWWGTGRPGVQQSIWLQRVRHAWVTEQQQHSAFFTLKWKGPLLHIHCSSVLILIPVFFFSCWYLKLLSFSRVYPPKEIWSYPKSISTPSPAKYCYFSSHPYNGFPWLA